MIWKVNINSWLSMFSYGRLRFIALPLNGFTLSTWLPSLPTMQGIFLFVMLYTFMINYDSFTLLTIHLLIISIIIILYCFFKQQQLFDLTSLEKFILNK